MSLRDLFAVALFLFATLLFAAPPGLAQSGDAFTMRGIKVDVTAATATKAREQAIAQGQTKAFRLLLERMVPRGEYKHLPNFPQAKIFELVSDFAVEQEKTSTVRYIASLTVRFKPEPVRRIILEANLAHSETMAKSVLVLPMLRVPGGALLWEEKNPWRQAFLDMPPPSGLVPMLVADGSKGEGQLANVSEAAALNAEKLSQLAKLYNAGDVLLVDAGLLAANKGKEQIIQYAVFRPGTPLPEQGEAKRVQSNSGEDQASFFIRAAQAAFSHIEDAWKSESLQHAGQAGSISAIVPINELSDWLTIRDKLAKTPIIQRYEVAAMMRDKITVAIHYSGDTGQLVRALAQKDISLKEGAEGWLLRSVGSRSGAGNP
jgi:hypothetical protein